MRIGPLQGVQWRIIRVHSGPAPCVPPGVRRRPIGLYPRPCTPVVEGVLWRLPSSQLWVPPGQGGPRRHCVTLLLSLPVRTIGQLVCHATGSGGVPVHRNYGRVMVEGT